MAETRVGAISVLLIFVLILVAFVPALFANTKAAQSQSVIVTENNTYSINRYVDYTIQDINNSNVSLRVYNDAESQTVENISKTNPKSTTFDSETLTFYYDEDIDSNTSQISYEYHQYIGYPDNTKIVFENLGMISILVILSFFIVLYLIVI